MERLYGIYYKLRRERDEAAIVRNLIHFMAVFYSKPELSEMSERLSDDVGIDWQAMRLRTTALLHQGDRDAVLEAFRATYVAFRIGKRTMLREMLELAVELIVFGVSERELAEVLSSDRERADALAPLVVALRKRAGEAVARAGRSNRSRRRYPPRNRSEDVRRARVITLRFGLLGRPRRAHT